MVSVCRIIRARGLCLLGGAAGALFGCSSPFSPATHVSGCADGTAVHASAGLTPQFTWGSCKVAVVGVEPVDANGLATSSPVWGINGDRDANGIRNNLIESGVRYGEKPKFTTTGTLTPLHGGQRYRVFILMTGPASSFGFDAGGEGFFVP